MDSQISPKTHIYPKYLHLHNIYPKLSSSWSMLLVLLRGSFPSIFSSPKMSSISSLEFLESSEFCLFFLLSSSSIFLMSLPSSSSLELDLGELGSSVMLTLRPLLDSKPIKRQHLGHMISIDQSEASIQVT